MNADLQATLDELGPGYREMVLRMRRNCDFSPAYSRRPRWKGVAAMYSAAAALVLALGFSVVFFSRSGDSSQPSRLAIHSLSSPYLLAYCGVEATEEILRTQKADGSWENDFLTRQNAAALRGVATASVAYRKALRYLRSRGLAPLTDDELRSRAHLALQS